MSSGKGQSILEKWLQDMPSSNHRPVKRERKDCDDLLASKSYNSSNLFLNQFSSSTTSSSSTQVNNGIRAQDLSKLPKKQAPEPLQDLTNCIDAKSIKGIFGWSTVNDIPLPVILREDQKLVPVRIVESKVIGKYSESLPWTVFSCINVRSYYITENEAKLLNEINGFHCDYHYGYEQFTAKDVVVCLSDVVTLSEFLEQSEQIFNQGLSKADIDGLGFVNISGFVIVPYICKKIPNINSSTTTTTNASNSKNSSSSSTNTTATTTNDSSAGNSNSIFHKYIPESLIANFVLLVKVDKVDMTEWDASYLKMLYIYAGIDHYQIPPNDKLCLLSDLKWDSSLCPLQIEECDPRVTKLNYRPKNCLTSPFSLHGSESVTSDVQPRSPINNKPSNSSCINHNQPWPLSPTDNGSNSALNSLHQITKVDIEGLAFNAINLKPYSPQKAVLVNDIVTKMFPGVNELAAHYFLEKILQVKLYECNSLHRGTFARAYITPLPGDKLVAVDVLRKCLPQLSKLILVSSKPHRLN